MSAMGHLRNLSPAHSNIRGLFGTMAAAASGSLDLSARLLRLPWDIP